MRDWVHGVGHSPVCQILLQIVSRAHVEHRKYKIIQFTFDELLCFISFVTAW